MRTTSHKAFTMLELTFVIVIIGILAAIAIPKLAATRDDAIIAKARSTVASVRNAIATERQKRILRGDFTPITLVDSGNANQNDSPIFDRFDGNSSSNRVLEYPLRTCKDGTSTGCWIRTDATTYTYRMPIGNTHVDFNITNNRFDCVTPSDANCKLLTE